MAKRVLILTGSELRHGWFAAQLTMGLRDAVVSTYQEQHTKTVEAMAKGPWQKKHAEAMKQAERDFFSWPQLRASHVVEHGWPNTSTAWRIIQDEIRPDLIVCFGCSILRNADLLETYERRILNLHLGLSPYYRGSGTNVWAIHDGYPERAGATIMWLDAGVDTGEVIHQERARPFSGDGPHHLMNRIIVDGTAAMVEVANMFPDVPPTEPVVIPESEVRVTKRAGWCEETAYDLDWNGAETVRSARSNWLERCAESPIVRNPGIAS